MNEEKNLVDNEEKNEPVNIEEGLEKIAMMFMGMPYGY